MIRILKVTLWLRSYELIKAGFNRRLDFIKNKLVYKRFFREFSVDPSSFLYYFDLDVMFPTQKCVDLMKELYIEHDDMHMILTIFYYTTEVKGKIFDDFFREN
ncbi:MAG: hypothetical protein FJZ43_00105 [Candidatus Staskawiczbacteria bacterium]|nr:hypothetical protein [Candidatus Staskawiczbacteria bacterium]